MKRKINITLVSVMSADGRLTNGTQSDAHSWTSAEDWEEFVSLRSKHDTLVMDVETYESIMPVPDNDWLRIVICDNPEKYEDRNVLGQLEFVSVGVKEIVENLEHRGCARLLVVGGPVANGDFLRAGLVDEIYLTFEPVIFGAGQPLALGQAFDVSLELVSVKTLNKRGTIQFHYRVRD